MLHAVPKVRFLKPNIMLFYIMPRRKSYNIPRCYNYILYVLMHIQILQSLYIITIYAALAVISKNVP